MHRMFVLIMISMISISFQVLTGLAEPTGNMAISNVAPDIDNTTVTDEITLQSGAYVMVWFNSTILDFNGPDDIDNVSAVFWNPAQTTESGADDVRNHYTNSSCYYANLNTTHVTSNCLFRISSDAVSGTWTAKLRVNDSANNSNNATSSVVVNAVPSGSAPPSSGGSGGGGGSSAEPPSIPPAESPPPIPEQLLDVKLEIEDKVIYNIRELIARTTFESFGTEPAEISLTYTILDEINREVYTEIDYITVQTYEVVTKKFEDLNLGAGKYTLFLQIRYFTNVTEEFEQSFEIKKEEIEAGVMPWPENIYIITSLFGLILIAYTIRRIRKKRQELKGWGR